MTIKMTTREMPKAMKHGDLEEVFKNVFVVKGSLSFKKPLPMSFSRNMTVIREGDALTIVNSVRLSDEGLKQLDALGQVQNIVRLAGFHGMDDPFYKDRYGATVWSVDAPYAVGTSTDPAAEDIYFAPDHKISTATDLPIEDAQIVAINSAKPKEALLLLRRDGGILVSGDCLQNWAKPDKYFSFLAKIFMRRGGFIKAANVGPAWLKFTKADTAEIRGLLGLEFDKLIPAHGEVISSGAKESYRSVISAL